jgi:hypothetical protein
VLISRLFDPLGWQSISRLQCFSEAHTSSPALAFPVSSDGTFALTPLPLLPYNVGAHVRSMDCPINDLLCGGHQKPQVCDGDQKPQAHARAADLLGDLRGEEACGGFHTRVLVTKRSEG